jgi:hypothetical protein
LAINDPAPVAHLENYTKSSLPVAVSQPNLGFTDSEQGSAVGCFHAFSALADDHWIQYSGLGLFPNARNVLITGGTFVSLFL